MSDGKRDSGGYGKQGYWLGADVDMKPRDLRNGFQDANGMSVREGDEVEYRFGARRGTLTYCGHDGSAWVHFFDSGRDEDVNWNHLCGVPDQYRTPQ